MQLTFTFSALLVVLYTTLFSQHAQAAPLHARKPQNGMVTLPLRRVQPRSSNVHPTVLLQQHLNRGNRRLARMTGRAEPSQEELRDHIVKRLVALEADALEKRYNRQGTNVQGVKAVKPVGPVASSASNGAKTLAQKGNVGKGTSSKGVSANANGAGSAASTTGKAAKSTDAGNAASAATGNAGSTAVKGAKQGKAVKAKSKNGAAGVNAGAGTAAGQATAGVADAGAAVAASGTNAAEGVAAAAAANPGVSPLKAAAIANPGVTAAGPPTGDNSLGLDIEANDIGYLATITMGTPPRDFLLLMDSGSADLWVGAENCQSEAGGGCGNHKFLGPQSSSSFVDTKAPFEVTYGTGNVKGDIVTDNINVAGLVLNKHTFGVATAESVDFSDDSTPFDGLMGLAQSSLSEQKTLTPIEALAKQGLVKNAIVSYKIPRLDDQKNDGEITFGDVDPAKFDAQTLETLENVSQQGFWEAAMPAVTVNGQSTGLQGRTSILDTGTTLIIAPAADAEAVHQLIPGAKSDNQGGFTVPCTTTASVALTFGKTSFAIDPRDLAFAPVDPNDPAGDCVSGIASGNIGGATEWLVGDVFLKNAYFSTDVTNNQLSLAKLA
ncbi:hypothetical protein HGRIS_003585 [Hohenbuehelia grisea]|uniref:Peptidase A1 domain-containing protein n=1 Tax=Hohenbuehelia grisea TaxID=104357 RepID=A0ABR3JGP5_9AGAR